jgi:alpha-L-arabinofuranosidase
MIPAARNVLLVIYVTCVSASFPSPAEDRPEAASVLRIKAGSRGTEVSPALFGAFFEDINHGADGGLYAELVRNRSFESPAPADSWRVVGEPGKASLELRQGNPIDPGNPRYARVRVAGSGLGIANEGYGGMNLVAGESYSISAYIRSDDPKPASLAFVLKEGSGGAPLAECEATGITKEWRRFESLVVPRRGASSGRLEILASGPGSFEIDFVSVFPRGTFKDRPNGLRADLAGMVADLKPGFLRFPGGCVVEGRTIATAYRWKDTIGDIARRRENENLWGYRQSYGLGLLEYLRFCEDIGAEPLPVVNCGMACQARNGDMVPVGELGPWIRDALDLIEYAKGGADSGWGRLRAASGHPEPFGLKYLAVGNEQWGPEYYARYEAFAEAIKAERPEIKLIFAAGPVASGVLFDEAWRQARKLGADLVDEHYYMAPEWFLENTRRYDGYDRKGPKVFLGEYAAQAPGKVGNLYAALAEAAFMTGLERNGDLVELASYAPLLAREGFAQWAPDMIWFDGREAYGSPSYYVQKLFSNNRSAASLPYSLEVSPAVSRKKPLGGGIGLATWGTRAEFKDLEVTGRDGKPLLAPSLDSLDGWKAGTGIWKSEGGIISQRSAFSDCRLVFNAPDWSDYSIEIKARKRSGTEGLIVMFGIRGADYYRWNLGGWGNTASAVEKGSADSRAVIGESLPLSIETDRWYDLKVEIRGDSVRCFLDKVLIHEIRDQGGEGPIYAHAGRDAEGGYILKLVNVDASPRRLRIELENSKPLEGSCSATILSGTEAGAVNSFVAPKAVYPKTRMIEAVSTDFTYELEPNSLTVLRIPLKK